MKKKILLNIFLIAFSFMTVNAQIVISQYYEGSGNDKWIELTNIGSSAVDLATTPVSLMMIAGSDAKDVTLTDPVLIADFNSGTWDAGAVKLVKHGSAVLPDYAVADVSNSSMSFNGAYDVIFTSSTNSTTANEAWSLRIDAVGEVDGSNLTTADNIADISLVRNAEVTASNQNYTASEWTQYANTDVDNAAGTSTEYLGVHIYGTDPSIQTAPSELSGFEYNVGSGPSPEQSFIVSATNATANMLVTPPTNYEISKTSGTDYTSSAIELTRTGSDIGPETIYVRLKADLGEGTYDENIECTTTGAETKYVACSGEVLNPLVPQDLPYFIDFTAGDINQDFWANQAASDPNYEWNIEDLSGNNVVRMGNYNSGSYDNASVWYVSPPMNTSGETELALNFAYAVYDYTKGKLIIMASNDYDGTSNPETQGTWVDFTPTFTSGNYNTLEAAPEIDLSSLLPAETVNIAFKFEDLSDTGEGNTWRIDDISVSNTLAVAVNTLNNTLKIYPNPANDYITFNKNYDNITITDITGKTVLTTQNQTVVNINTLKAGLYIIHAEQFTAKFIKR